MNGGFFSNLLGRIEAIFQVSLSAMDNACQLRAIFPAPGRTHTNAPRVLTDTVVFSNFLARRGFLPEALYKKYPRTAGLLSASRGVVAYPCQTRPGAEFYFAVACGALPGLCLQVLHNRHPLRNHVYRGAGVASRFRFSWEWLLPSPLSTPGTCKIPSTR